MCFGHFFAHSGIFRSQSFNHSTKARERFPPEVKSHRFDSESEGSSLRHFSKMNVFEVISGFENLIS